MTITPDFAAALRTESAAFRTALQTAEPDAPVPSCPDWSATDLLWHLTEVQWFWGQVVAHDVRDPQSLDRPERPADLADLFAMYDDAGEHLQAALQALPDATERWMWTADPALHTAGYIRRRQAHEALVHRVDAELVARQPVSVIDAALAADGIDEVVHVMYGREHALLTFAPTQGQVVRIAATDASVAWTLQLGRERGVIPESGEHIDDANFRPVDDIASAATVSGTVADLDLWLWNRPTSGQLTRSGDSDALQALDEILAAGLQ
ncbi:maleylpyruvate isomerase N-terminal domain-containing protein [Rudaeicoccus suwonensis]|uniref:Uncharacterized protein (TIGR03083 family) n=1 Tax=Rudaeicoccus suwonensis TaxID=657409 RepID=A0A561E9V3_9MICO|nr:maleylpyruvate isomerase N-terminal domain-containing protein [Rudaeicoccus suwonensis]TWE12367.1 uncharacterized protein (TIGR03083 family) [Rudaeicoccus suwonensis]